MKAGLGIAMAAAGFAAALVASAAAQRGLASWREGELEAEDPAYNADVPPETRFTVAALGGLRGVVSEFIRLHASNLQREGNYTELAQLSAWLTQLDPHAADSWTMAAWNLSYNISSSTDVKEDKWRWVLAGMKMLRDDALRANPRDPSIHYELMWLFLNKINGTLDDVGRYYNESWRDTVRQAAGDWASLKMEPALMRKIDAAYGPLDWSDPLSSAVYWGEHGLAAAPARVCARLRLGLAFCMFAKVRADAAYAPRALERIRALSAAGPDATLDEMAAALEEFIKGGGAAAPQGGQGAQAKAGGS